MPTTLTSSLLVQVVWEESEDGTREKIYSTICVIQYAE